MEDLRDLKKELVEYGKRIIQRGLVVGPGGNISIRYEDTIYLSPSGFAFDEVTEDLLVGVNLYTEDIVEGNLKPTCEIAMHLGCYRVRPDIRAIIHTHPPLATGVVSAGVKLRPLTAELVALVGSIPILDYILPSTKELADAVSKAIKDHNAVLMINHGCLTVGANLREAFYRTEIIEDSARLLIAAMTVGKPRFLTPEEEEAIKKLEAENYRKSLLAELPKNQKPET